MKQIIAAALLLTACQGCIHGLTNTNSGITENAIPAHLAREAFDSISTRDNRVPIDFTWLRQAQPKEHVIGPDDVLGIYVEGVLDVPNQLPTVYFPPQERRSIVQSPSVGHPVMVRHDGTVLMPLVGPIDVDGLTLAQATTHIRQTYLEREMVSADRGHVTVDLIRPRTFRVFVLREDSENPGPSLVRGDTQPFTKRGASFVLELPVYENDLLTALSETGGLPGIDAYNEVWVLRQSDQSNGFVQQLQSGVSIETLGQQPNADFVRVPLRICPGQPAPFAPADVVLQDGDVVFLESREIEYFLTGGLIGGGKFPLPRDHDVDIFEAIAIANSNVMGPAGNATATNFRSGPGNIVAPSDAVVLRTLDNGEQVKILVDLRVAFNDHRERINILPRDMIVLRYKPRELMANIALNFVNFNYSILAN